MSGILRLESLTKGNTLRQGDLTLLKYRLFDADGDKLDISGKSATVRLMKNNFTFIAYEKEGLTVAPDDTISFSVNKILPSGLYHLEVIVDGQYIFPSRDDEGNFNIDKSSLGADVTIVEATGVEAVARKATGMMKQDEEFIDDMIANVISDTNVGNIEEYYNQFNEATTEFKSLKTQALNSVTKSDKAIADSASAKSIAQGIDAKATNALSLSESVQNDFNQIVTGFTDKDIVSAPEITLARKGYIDLESRLDDELPVNPKWFGAKGDGVTDDGQALKLAHEFANSTGRKVLYPAGTYYLYEVSNIPIMTDVDASRAEIVINPSFEPTRSMFDIIPTESKYQIYPELSTLVVNKNTTSLPQLAGYGDAILELINDNKKVYIRYGANANVGSSQSDKVVIDTHGNLKNDIVWDFDEVTRAFIYPIDKTFIDVVFGRITYMNNIDRTTYAYKNIIVTRSRVNLTVMDEGLVPLAKKSPYAGVISTSKCAYVTIKDSNLENKPTVKNDQGVDVGTYGLLLQGTIFLTLINVRSKEIPDEFNGWGIMGGNVLKDFKVIDCDLNRIDSHQGTHNITIENTTVGKHGCTLTGSGNLKMSNVKFLSANVISLRADFGSTWDGDIVLNDVEHTPQDTTTRPSVIRATPIIDHDFGYPCHFGRRITIKNYKVNTDFNDVIPVLRTDLPRVDNPTNKYILPDVINLENLTTSNNAKQLRVFLLPNENYLDFSTNTEGSYQIVEGETRIVSNIEINIDGGDWIDFGGLIGWNDYRTNAFSQGHESYQPTSPYPTININNVSSIFLNIVAHAWIVNIYGGSVKRIYAENGGGSRGVITVENSDIKTNGTNFGIRLPKDNSSRMINCVIYPPMDGENVKSSPSDILQAHDAIWGTFLDYNNPRPNIINCILSNDYPISIIRPNWEDYMMPILNMKTNKYYHPKRGTLNKRPSTWLEVGDTYFNTDSNKLEVWTGTTWV